MLRDRENAEMHAAIARAERAEAENVALRALLRDAVDDKPGWVTDAFDYFRRIDAAPQERT